MKIKPRILTEKVVFCSTEIKSDSGFVLIFEVKEEDVTIHDLRIPLFVLFFF